HLDARIVLSTRQQSGKSSQSRPSFQKSGSFHFPWLFIGAIVGRTYNTGREEIGSLAGTGVSQWPSSATPSSRNPASNTRTLLNRSGPRRADASEPWT